jgi:hypothetical protein
MVGILCDNLSALKFAYSGYLIDFCYLKTICMDATLADKLINAAHLVLGWSNYGCLSVKKL